MKVTEAGNVVMWVCFVIGGDWRLQVICDVGMLILVIENRNGVVLCQRFVGSVYKVLSEDFMSSSYVDYERACRAQT